MLVNEACTLVQLFVVHLLVWQITYAYNVFQTRRNLAKAEVRRYSNPHGCPF